MKKIFLLCLTAGAALALTGCVNNPDGKKDDDENHSTVKIEDGTPQEWIDLFTFTNVTISVKQSLSLLDEPEYRCVDGKWYVKGEKETAFSEFKEDPATIYQIAYAHYSKFTYDENYYYYKAEKMKIDDSQFSYSVTVMLDPNSTETRIGWIYSNAFISDSLDTTTTLEFKDYGTTRIN